MKYLSLCVIVALCASPVHAQRSGPIRDSIEKTVAGSEKAAAAADGNAPDETAKQVDSKGRKPSGRKSALFWAGLAAGVAGVTTSALGLTVMRTERTSTGNAPDNAYRACVAQQETNAIYATNQCGALKGKNLKLLWGGVAIGGAGAALMIRGRNTSAALAPGAISVFHRWRF